MATLQKSTFYSVYVLFLLMATYLTNQTDRFVLGITSEKLSKDLSIGHEGCVPNMSWTGSISGNSSTKCSSDCQAHKTEAECSSVEDCSWEYLSTGIKYQVLAGPAFIVIFSLASLPMGLFASIHSIKRTVVLGVCVCLWSIMTLLTAYVTKYWEIVLARFGLGVFQAACTPFASSILSDYFKPEYRGTALSIYSWGVYIGYSLAFAFNFIVENYGWRWAFRVASFPGFLISCLLIFTVKEPTRNNYRDINTTKSLMYGSKSSLLKNVLVSYLQLPLLLLCIGAGLRQGGGLVWAYNAKSYFRLMYCDVHGVGTYISWIPVVGGSLGVVIGGYISDYLVKKWNNKARILVLTVSSLLSIPFLFGVLFIPLPGAFFSLLLAYCVGEMWFAVAIAVAIELVPIEVSSAAVSLYLFIINIIGGNLNLLLPTFQKSIGLQNSMIILFPGAYFISGVFFILAGLCWNVRFKNQTTVSDSFEEKTALIQNTSEEDLNSVFSESHEETEWRKRKTPAPINHPSLLSSSSSYAAPP